VVLERNPNYWKTDRAGQRLPYLDELTFLAVAKRGCAGDPLPGGRHRHDQPRGRRNFAVLEKDAKARGYALQDLGPGLEYTFLFFNLGDLAGKGLDATARRQAWFKDAASDEPCRRRWDRVGMARLAFGGRATPLGSHVTPGNKLWVDASLQAPAQSPQRARELLKAWVSPGKSDGHAPGREGPAGRVLADHQLVETPRA
jgi:peptide/nickel transport system substrate-binding protein